MDLETRRRLASYAAFGGVFGVVVLAGVLYLGATAPRGGTSSTSSAQTSPSYSALRAMQTRVVDYIGFIEARNGPAAGEFYSASASISWIGVQEPWKGNYSADVMPRLLDLFLGTSGNYSSAYSGLAFVPTGEDSVYSRFILLLSLDDSVYGSTNSSVTLSQSWFDYQGNWLIQSDTWNFTYWSPSTWPGP